MRTRWVLETTPPQADDEQPGRHHGPGAHSGHISDYIASRTAGVGLLGSSACWTLG